MKGTDAFHPGVLLNFGDESCEKVADFLHSMDVIGKWSATTSCIMFFLLPKAVDNDRLESVFLSCIRCFYGARRNAKNGSGNDPRQKNFQRQKRFTTLEGFDGWGPELDQPSHSTINSHPQQTDTFAELSKRLCQVHLATY